MKHIALIFLGIGLLALCGCTGEPDPQPPQKLPAVSLSAADKEKLAAFQKELLSVGNLADKGIKLATEEVKNVLKGGKVSLVLPSILDKAKAECLRSGAALAKKTVPAALPPEMKSLLTEGTAGLIAANAAYAESFDAIKSFVADKNPLVLLEYRKKCSQAQGLYGAAAAKFKVIMTAAGVAQ